MDYRLGLLLAASATVAADPAMAQDSFPAGVWTDTQQRIVVRVAPCDASSTTFCGVVVQDNRRGLVKNPTGHMIIRNLTAGPRQWSGLAFDGITRFSFTLHPTDTDRAKARLCVTRIFCLNEQVQRLSNYVAR